MYWDLIDLIIQAEHSLIELSILYKISWKDLLRLDLWFITAFVVELKWTGENSISKPCYSNLIFKNFCFI